MTQCHGKFSMNEIQKLPVDGLKRFMGHFMAIVFYTDLL